jgi:WD40 repeat protein
MTIIGMGNVIEFYNEGKVCKKIEIQFKDTIKVGGWDRDETRMAIGGVSGIIYIVNTSVMDGELAIKVENLPPGHGGEIKSLKFNPKKEELLASASYDKTIRLWDCNKKIQLCVIG